MNSAWRLFLEQQGARFDGDSVQHFGDPAAESVATRDGSTIAPLTQFGTLKVSGEDAQTFLQSLLSNDIRAVGAQQAQLSSFNTAKGRMLASFLIWQHDGDYFLQLARPLAAPIQKKLSMYVLRSKVKVSDVSDEWVALGITGAQQANEFGLPDGASATLACDAARLIRSDARRFQLVCPTDQASAWWQRLCSGNDKSRPVGSPCWDWLDIQAGIPVITPATQEQFVPQMVNLEVIGGVNFKKGCYPGQEIVARMQYLGKAKRRMYLAHVGGDSAPRPGDTLFSASPEENAHGMVVNAAPAPAGGFDLLGVLPIASRAHGDVRLGAGDGARLGFLALPYELP
ncbi:folate-binding protein YgfZ [Ferriphaselus sp. R-1]|uniref:CAF17-like 4Fe-4S cluster assembly/insertion protein YgfZ n=1 Tax=Ferriphaselus sp. R-1 TaxID=1485544 RepID=UPI0005558398|nr:folate-binding protein YgfZ [Ferriphaselus sp. R-1]